MKNRLKIYSLGLIVVTSFSACTKTDYLEIDAADRPPLSSKQRFINARGVESNLVFWNFTARLTGAVPPNTASAYVDGSYGSVQINATEGTGGSYIVSRLFGNSASFSASGGPNGPIATYYHSIFSAKSNSGQADSLILFYDNLEAPAAGKVKLRFVNLATGAGALDLRYNNGSLENVFSGVRYGTAGNQVLSGEALSAWTLGPFVEVNPGSGTAYSLAYSSNQSVVSLEDDLDNFTLEAGKIYTAFAVKVPGKSNVFSLHIIQHEKSDN